MSTPVSTTSRKTVSFEEAPLRPLHVRVAAFTAGGQFCDGYVLGIIALALPSFTKHADVSAVWLGLIGAASLIGMFLGGATFGYISDRIGRRTPYTLDLAILVLASAAQFFVNEGWQLFLLRILIGIAIGIDVPIGAALLTEFTPRRLRGKLLSLLTVGWWLGFTASFVVGYLLINSGPDAFRWMLVSSAVPGLFVLLLRIGTPESPRWLYLQGRRDEARKIVDRYVGSNVSIDSFAEQTGSGRRGSLRDIWKAGYGRRLVFVSIFWGCQVAPAYAIRTFQPQILEALGVKDPALAALLIAFAALFGVVVGMLAIDRIGRRPMLIGSFAVMVASLALTGMASILGVVVVVVAFVVYNIVEPAGTVLQLVYPGELFPTEIRGTATGLATSLSRIGGAASTFVTPVAMASFGTTTVMFATAGVCLAALMVCIRMAPETKGLDLRQTSSIT